MTDNKVFIYKGDLLDSDVLRIKNSCRYIAVDTETTGLDPLSSNLSIVQIAADNEFFIVHIDPIVQATNLSDLLADKTLIKVFHHAPFDLSFLMYHLGINDFENVICTKVAFKLIHGLDKKSSLKELLLEYLNVRIDKTQRMSDWSKFDLDQAQIEYALNDVRYLVNLWEKIDIELRNNNLNEIAKECFDFLPTQAKLSNNGIKDIFRY